MNPGIMVDGFFKIFAEVDFELHYLPNVEFEYIKDSIILKYVVKSIST